MVFCLASARLYCATLRIDDLTNLEWNGIGEGMLSFLQNSGFLEKRLLETEVWKGKERKGKDAMLIYIVVQ